VEIILQHVVEEQPELVPASRHVEEEELQQLIVEEQQNKFLHQDLWKKRSCSNL
jgi:hypothetical protein